MLLVQIRAGDRRAMDVLLARELLAQAATPSEQVVEEELARRVRAAVAELPDLDREILLMRNFEGLSNQDVSRVLEIETDAANKRYGRALFRLRAILVENGLTGTA